MRSWSEISPMVSAASPLRMRFARWSVTWRSTTAVAMSALLRCGGEAGVVVGFAQSTSGHRADVVADVEWLPRVRGGRIADGLGLDGVGTLRERGGLVAGHV